MLKKPVFQSGLFVLRKRADFMSGGICPAAAVLIYHSFKPFLPGKAEYLIDNCANSAHTARRKRPLPGRMLRLVQNPVKVFCGNPADWFGSQRLRYILFRNRQVG